MLRKTKVLLLLLLAASLIAVSVVEISAQSAESPEITIRKVEAQTMLYTVYRGSYEKIGQTISDLYALAGKNKLTPCGPLTLVYLNNPKTSTMEHCLTEIRIQVSQEANSLAGKLGPMTDVKTLNSMDVAIMTKSVGQYDYAGLFEKIYSWIVKSGYRPVDSPCEVFSAGQQQNYEQMKSEIMIPIVKVSSIKQ